MGLANLIFDIYQEQKTSAKKAAPQNSRSKEVEALKKRGETRNVLYAN
jgi:hypothetical protein